MVRLNEIDFAKIRDGSLIIAGEGVEEINKYLIKISSSLSDFLKILVPPPALQKLSSNPLQVHVYIPPFLSYFPFLRPWYPG